MSALDNAESRKTTANEIKNHSSRKKSTRTTAPKRLRDHKSINTDYYWISFGMFEV